MNDTLAAYLMNQPLAIGRLLAEHVDDGRGHCRTCTVGAQQGHSTWPCTIHHAASMADRARKSGNQRPRA